jgi:hypothetical protein
MDPSLKTAKHIYAVDFEIVSHSTTVKNKKGWYGKPVFFLPLKLLHPVRWVVYPALILQLPNSAEKGDYYFQKEYSKHFF